jgi:hypothetical protein
MMLLFPASYRVEISKLRQQLDEAHLAWRKEWKSQQPDFANKNIRFEHKPDWNKRFFSIQSAHDGAHPVWKATKVIWVSMGGSV